MVATKDIDISENKLRLKGDLLNTLIIDRTSRKNIIWATDSYQYLGNKFLPNKQIKPDLITNEYSQIIQPRAAKSREEQKQRTKDKAEVFTPLKIVDQMNKSIDWAQESNPPGQDNWQSYVSELKLEITCGEAPFIVSRYNPTSHTGKILTLKSRVGFLDKKLRLVTKYCDKPKKWLKWAEIAYQSSYGYEWQGDNLLIARENLLFTMKDYYEDKFGRQPSVVIQQKFAEIISWNIFQMDGLKYTVPMSCRHETKTIPGENTIFGITPDIVEEYECEGCKFNRADKHNGKYVKIMDWEKDKPIKFIDLLNIS